MTTQNKIVPALRFAEFDGDWEEKKLDKIFDISAGGDISKENLSDLKTSVFKYPVYSNSERGRGLFGFSDKYRIEKECVTVSGRGALGKAFARFEKFYPIVRLLVLIPKESSDVIFYENIINRINFFVESTGVPQLTAPQISNYKIHTPTLPEQQKIAAFLTAVDEKIQRLAKKKDLLEQYKKGVMQKIFNQEIRFKDDNGNDFADWEEKKGNEVFDSISDKNHNSDLPILAITQEYGAIPRDLIDYQISVTDKSVESYKVVEVGDFIISLRSFQGGIEYSSYKGICSPAYIILRSKVRINDLFFKYYLKTDFYIQQLNSKLEGIRDGKMVSYKYFSEINLPFPSIEEQNKIANFFSAIDDKINLANQQLEKTKEYKKGLLQQMFV